MLTGFAWAPSLAGAVLADAPVADNPTLNGSTRALLGQLAEHVIPETDTPGALAAGVDRFLTRMLESYLSADDAAAYRAGLASLDQVARGHGAERFVDLPQAEQRRLLEDLDRCAFSGDGSPLAEFWRRHKALTVFGYYTSEVGATVELRAMPMGPYEADIPYDQVGRSWS